MPLSLPTEITKHFENYEPHVIKNLLITTEGVFEAESTNLNKVKLKLPNILSEENPVKSSAHYKRLYRFFRDNEVNQEDLMRCLVLASLHLLGINLHSPKGRHIRYLTLDGTSWAMGEKKIHLLTLAIVVGSVSIPIWWEELDKKGLSNFKERKRVIEGGFAVMDLRGFCLLADREYLGRAWYNYLVDKGLDFVIRLKRAIFKQHVDEQCGVKSRLFAHQSYNYRGLENGANQAKYRYCGVCKQVVLLGYTYTLVVFKNPDPNAEQPLLYFISTLKKKRKIIKAYPIRWTIECCFKHLKSNGFDLEGMGFRKSKKIMLMMGIVVFLYSLCIRQGLLAYGTSKNKKWKVFRDGTRTLAVSIFKKGLENICGMFRDLRSFLLFLQQIFAPKKFTLKYNVQ